jgi:hypothetical protein
LEARELRITHHPDDAVGVDVLGQVQAKVPVERVLTRREESAHERLVHHGHVL